MFDMLIWIATACILFGVVLSCSPIIRDVVALAFDSPQASARRRVVFARALGHIAMALAWPFLIRGAVAGTEWLGRPSLFASIAAALRSYGDPNTAARLRRALRAEARGD